MNNMTQMLAFFSDIATANAGTLASANSYTDAQVLVEKNRATGAEGALTTNLSNEIRRAMGAETAETTRATGAETLLGASIATESARAIGVESGLSSAITAESARATAQELLKANLAGGNLFTGGKQTLAASAAGFASLNFPATGVTPTSPAPAVGDMWLTSGDNHLQFQSAAGLKSLAFTTDIAAGTVTGVTASSPLASTGGTTRNLTPTGIVPKPKTSWPTFASTPAWRCSETSAWQTERAACPAVCSQTRCTGKSARAAGSSSPQSSRCNSPGSQESTPSTSIR